MADARKRLVDGASELLRRFRARRGLEYFLMGLAVLAVFLFLAWLTSFRLDKKQADFWDISFKGLAGIVALVGAVVGLSKYFDERKKENQTALIEAQKPFSTKRQEVYYQLVSTTSTISNRGSEDPERKKAEDEFWHLFWGGVPMVADDQVSAAIDAFSVAIQKNRDEGELLRNLSMNLARACRKSLGFVEYN